MQRQKCDMVSAVHAQARENGSGLPGALFCVPVLVKDNIDAAGWATTAGAVALLDNLPQQDAQQVGGVACFGRGARMLALAHFLSSLL